MEKNEKITEEFNSTELTQVVSVLSVQEYKELSIAKINIRHKRNKFMDYIKFLFSPSKHAALDAERNKRRKLDALDKIDMIANPNEDKLLLLIHLKQGGFVVDEWNAFSEIINYGAFLKNSVKFTKDKGKHKLEIYIGNTLTLNSILAMLENPANDFQLDKLIFIHTPKVIPQDGKIYSDRKFLKIANLKSEDIVNRNIELILFNNDNSAGKEYKDNLNFEID